MRLPQTEILQRAERLASTLAGGQTRVERNVLLAVVADFMTDREPDREKLRRTLDLLAKGSGGHLERGGSYAAQIQTVAAELLALLAAETLETEDYRSLFGWTARLLLVRGLEPPSNGKTPPRGAAGGGGGAGGGPAREARQHPRKRPPAPPAPPGPLGAVSEKGLSTLQQLKQRLAEREQPKKPKDEQ
jgi:hypothetical protein